MDVIRENEKIARILIIFVLFNICFEGMSTVNAEYTKMWWEYLDEHYYNFDFVHINSNNMLCISKYDDYYFNDDSPVFKGCATQEILPGVKKVINDRSEDIKAVLMSDGSLYNWGNVVLGYDGIEDKVRVPQLVLNNVTDIDSGTYHMGALTDEGVLYVWGYCMYYDIFHSRLNIDDFQVDNIKQFEIYGTSIAILRNDCTLWILGLWGNNLNPNIYRQWHLLDTDVKEIDYTDNFAYVKNDGSLWMTGSNYYGQMAIPRALLDYTTEPVKIMDGVEKVSVNGESAMILKKDGTAYCVGDAVQSDVPQYIDDNIVAIDYPYMWKRDSTLLRGFKNNYSYKVIKFPFDIKMPDDIYKPILVNYNGNKLSFDQQPIIENGRTLVPMRAVFEALGATVLWDDESKCVIATKNNHTAVLKIDSDVMYINGMEIKLDVPAKLLNSRTLIPVRAIVEAFGCEVNWNAKEYSVSIID